MSPQSGDSLFHVHFLGILAAHYNTIQGTPQRRKVTQGLGTGGPKDDAELQLPSSPGGDHVAWG